MRMSRGIVRAAPWLGYLVLAALGVAMLAMRTHDGASHPDSAPTSAHAAASPAVRLDADNLVAPAERDALGELLRQRDDFAHDLLFLLAASLRDRCVPAHAHELARMAVAAHLPVLDGAEAAVATTPGLRHAAYALVRRLAAAAPCGRTLRIVIGGYDTTFAPERYAAAFPDSYFEPSLQAPPPDIADRDLGARAADPCTPVVYAVLPLDAARAWSCLGLRATLRRRLRDTCDAGLHGGKTVDAPTAAHLAASLHDNLEALPAMCR
jgi:hypothetical protein